MACCGGKHRDEPPLAEIENSASTLRRSITSSGIQPVPRSTRDTDLTIVSQQRRQASVSISDEPSRVRSNTRVALAQQPRSHRISRIGTAARGLLVQKIETASKSPVMNRSSSGSKAAILLERLASLSLGSVEMDPDGNCQFRAFADQLFGSQQYHAVVRQAAVAHMKAQADYFGIFFESADEFSAYMREMSRSRTWGDELTLRAVVEAFGCVTHVVTSEDQNWYLVYTPEAPPPPQVKALVTKLCASARLREPKPQKEVFINYISPIHYNAVCAAGI
jgi:hypothetical protein